MSADKNAERKPYLDGLRGVAACVVFVGHLSLSLTGSSFLFNGTAAVCIFFVLSGYVLSELAQSSPLSFPAQAVRRYIRLVVPMLVTSTFAWALLAAGLYAIRRRRRSFIASGSAAGTNSILRSVQWSPKRSMACLSRVTPTTIATYGPCGLS
jgi:peptidoglycan/LPS O-acetylase OafA/YrhL